MVIRVYKNSHEFLEEKIILREKEIVLIVRFLNPNIKFIKKILSRIIVKRDDALLG